MSKSEPRPRWLSFSSRGAHFADRLMTRSPLRPTPVCFFAFKPREKGSRRYVFRVTAKNKGFWNGIQVSDDARDAEEAARKRLESQKLEYVTLVPPEKDPSAPGFDVAGIGRPKKNGGRDRITVGEVKLSGVAKGRWFSAPEFTAIAGSPLGKNLDELQTEALKDPSVALRVEAALRSGSIDFLIVLSANARLSLLQRVILRRTIKTDLSQYLMGLGYPKETIQSAVRNITIRVTRQGRP